MGPSYPAGPYDDLPHERLGAQRNIPIRGSGATALLTSVVSRSPDVGTLAIREYDFGAMPTILNNLP
jgi:hypothetical protein